MRVVDSHCHAGLHWSEPVDLLLHQMDANHVEHAVLVQLGGQLNNEYYFDVVRRFPGRFACVVGIDEARPDAESELRRLAKRGATGVRLTAATRSPGPDPLAIWRAAADLGLSVSCRGATREFGTDAFARVVQAVPTLRIAIEHLGGSNHDQGQTLQERRRVFALARFPNVSIKIHGLGEFCPRPMPLLEPFPFETPIPPLFDMAYDAFGPDRMMWGSDFPPVAGREGYRNALLLALDRFASRDDHDRERIFGGVALEMFPLCR